MDTKLKNCKRIFIIGNADSSFSLDHIISEEDFIVRFNKPNISCNIKTDMLFIANGPRMIIRKTELFNNLLNENCTIIWRYSIKDILSSRYERISLSRKIRYPFLFSKFKKINTFDQYPSSVYDQNMQKKCTSFMHEAIPSTGFLAIYMLKTQYPHIPIYIHNFTFQGWEGHLWDSEEKIINQWIESKELAVSSSLL